MLYGVALAGIILPHLAEIAGRGSLDLYFLGFLIALCALSLAGARGITKAREKIWSMGIALMSVVWLVDQIISMLFGVYIPNPWWAIIEVTILAFMGVASLIRAGREPSDCLVYYRAPKTFLDVLACLLSVNLKSAAVQIDGEYYGFRNDYCRKLPAREFEHGYEVHYYPRRKAERLRRAVGKEWGWRNNCFWIL